MAFEFSKPLSKQIIEVSEALKNIPALNNDNVYDILLLIQNGRYTNQHIIWESLNQQVLHPEIKNEIKTVEINAVAELWNIINAAHKKVIDFNSYQKK